MAAPRRCGPGCVDAVENIGTGEAGDVVLPGGPAAAEYGTAGPVVVAVRCGDRGARLVSGAAAGPARGRSHAVPDVRAAGGGAVAAAGVAARTRHRVALAGVVLGLVAVAGTGNPRLHGRVRLSSNTWPTRARCFPPCGMGVHGNWSSHRSWRPQHWGRVGRGRGACLPVRSLPRPGYSGPCAPCWYCSCRRWGRAPRSAIGP